MTPQHYMCIDELNKFYDTFSKCFFFDKMPYITKTKHTNRNNTKDDIYKATDTKKKMTTEQINTNNNVTRLNIGQ